MQNKSTFWKPMYRDLKAGDIIRTVVSNKNHKDYGNYYYAVAQGTGFGSQLDTRGNAIFIFYQNRSFNKVWNWLKNINTTSIPKPDRWERYWGIEIFDKEGREFKW